MKINFFASLLLIIISIFNINFISFADTMLTEREKDIVFISSYTAKGDMAALDKALNQALDDKLKIYEIKEILLQSYAYCGFPRSLNALTAFMKVTDERSAKGIYDDFGTEPKEFSTEQNRFEVGAAVQTELVGAPVTGRLYEFEPAIDKFVKEHLFADIFSRGVLSYDEREIATIAALATMKNVEPQLKAHIQIALNIGISQEKIDEILALTKYKIFKNKIFDRGNKNNTHSQYYTGQNYLNELDNNDFVACSNVTFEPGCINNWHINHKIGQVLLVTQGEGYYQEWGEPVRELKAGDVVDIPAETKHWYGARKNSWFVHISIETPVKNGYTEWLEPVSTEEYNKLR